MFKHALLTALCVVVASVLGVTAAQMNESSQAFMVARDQSTINMAEVEFRHGKDSAMTEMAQEIIAPQKQDIEQFKKWQAEPM